jgi:hypothetical protein
LERRTAENESLFWATATAHERTHDPRAVDHGKQLANQAASFWPTMPLWGTPKASQTMGKWGRTNGRIYLKLDGQAERFGATWDRNEYPTPGADSFRSRSGDRKDEQGLDQMARGMTWDRNEYPTPSATPYGTSQNEGQVPHARPTAGTPSLDTWAHTWATPTAHDGRRPGADLSSTQGGNLNRDAAQWPTPTRQDAKSDGNASQQRRNTLPLNAEAAVWPTPTAGDAKASGAAGYSTESGRHEGVTPTDAAVGQRGRRDRRTPKAGGAGSQPVDQLPPSTDDCPQTSLKL